MTQGQTSRKSPRAVATFKHAPPRATHASQQVPAAGAKTALAAGRPSRSSESPGAGKVAPTSQPLASSSTLQAGGGGGTRAAAGSRACALRLHHPCGGVEVCGVDRECPAKGCCAFGLTCRRQTQQSWQCM
jgi:hypothetical protein